MFYGLTLAIFFIIFLRLTLTHFRWALLLFCGLLPAYVMRFQIGPLPTTVLEGMFLILFLRWAISVWRDPSGGQRMRALSRTLFFTPGLLLVIASAIAIAWSADTRAALGIWRAYFLEPFLLYVLLIDQFTDEQDWRDVFISLGGTTLALTLIALVQRLTGWWSPTWEWTQAGSRRVTSLYTSPNALGLFVVPIMSAYAWFIAREKHWQRWPMLVLAAGALAIILAISKGAMIAFGVSLFLIAWFFMPKRTYVVAGIVIAAALFLVTPLRNLATFQTPSGQSRLQLYQGTIALLQQHPIKGLGLANFGKAFERVRTTQYTEKLIYPHSIFLNFWSETGLFGLVTVVWITALIAKLAFQYRQQPKHAIWFFIVALLPMLVHGLIDVPYFKNDLAMLTWLLLAGLSVYASREKSVLY